jgi:DNA-binding NarL/FixJ family response regulator
MTGPAAPAARVLVADPAPLFRDGVVAALAAAGDLQVVGEAGDAASVREAVSRFAPDVVVLDAWLDGDGITTCAELAATHPGLRVLVVANPAQPVDLTAVAAAGATGYLAREAPAEELVQAVRTSAEGRALLSPEVATQLMGELASLARRRGGDVPAGGAGATRLSGRELEVLRLVAEGLSNRAIAERLFISENTVKNHVRSVHEKLQVHSRMAAVVRAARDGLLEMG